MSKAPLGNVNNTEADIGLGAGTSLPLSSTGMATSTGGHQYPPWSNQGLRGESNFVDSSGPIFSMYLEMAEEEDKKLAESWKADADGILIFVRLYLHVPCFTSIHQL